MKQLTIDDLIPLARGATILGSGGGGCPGTALLETRYQMEQHGPVQLIDVDELADDALVVPVAFIGAPLVGIERLLRGDEVTNLVRAIESYTGRKVGALMPAEIGGSNALTPIGPAATLGIPVLDADTLGRAFPEMQMTSCNLHGVSPSPTFMADSLGNTHVLLPETPQQAEDQARKMCCEMGMMGMIALYLMDGKEAQRAVVAGTISQAITLGKQRMAGTTIATGTIIDVEQELSGGFLCGQVSLEGGVSIHYQNEYLLAKRGDEVLAATPTILTLFEEESDEPIPCERLRYGLRVQLVAIDAPPIWTTREGLDLVGPDVFKLGEKR